MKRPTLVVSVASVACSATSAMAAFTGLETEFAGIVNGRSVFRVYAVASEADDVMLNLFDHRMVSGSMSGVLHADNYQDNAGGSPGHWSASYTGAGTAGYDSFVTVTGRTGSTASTSLDPSFGTGVGAVIPHNAGWYTSNPATPIVVGTFGTQVGNNWRLLVMQVAGNGLNYNATVSLGWKQNVGTTIASFTMNQAYGIPAPGAIALLSAAGMAGRRRRLGR